MITNVIIILTIVIVGGVFILDHFAIERKKQEQEAARKAREERRAAKEREQELKTVKATKESAGKGAESNARNETADGRTVDLRTLDRITFACDAGMGSSAMGATVLKKKLADVGRRDIEVTHASVSEIPEGTQIVVTHQDLAARAKKSAPNARLITISNFMSAPEYDQLAEELRA